MRKGGPLDHVVNNDVGHPHGHGHDALREIEGHGRVNPVHNSKRRG